VSEFKQMRSEGYFVPRDGGPPIIIRDLKIESFEEITEFLDLDGRVVRTERKINGVLQKDDQS
jgi:hypothetical protein